MVVTIGPRRGERYEAVLVNGCNADILFARIVSVAILPMTVMPFATGVLNPMMDGLLIGLVLVHSHIGFE